MRVGEGRQPHRGREAQAGAREAAAGRAGPAAGHQSARPARQPRTAAARHAEGASIRTRLTCGSIHTAVSEPSQDSWTCILEVLQCIS